MHHSRLTEGAFVCDLALRIGGIFFGLKNMKERILVVGAHFDDIAFAMAGTVAKFVKKGEVVDEAIMTDSNGQGISKTRLKEEREAMRLLGITKLYNIGIKNGYKDGELRNSIFEPMAQALIAIINIASKKGFPYTKIITFGDDGYTGHLDHKAVASVSRRAFEKSSSISELWQVGMSKLERDKWNRDYEAEGGYFVPIPLIDISDYKRMNISTTYSLKQRSILAHRSQLANGGELHSMRISELPKFEYFKIIRKNVYTRK